MKLALAEVPAPYLLEPCVMAQGAGGGWSRLTGVLAEAGLVGGLPPGDIAAALAYLSELKSGPRRRIERVLEARPSAPQPAELLKPAGPDSKLLLTEGRVALTRSNDQKPAKSPVGFSLFETAFADPGATLRLPDPGAGYDAEAVLVAVIGRDFHRGSESSAGRSVVGFTLMCQITHRDLFDEEAVTRNNLMAKNRDRLSPLGPAIWIAPPAALDAATVVTFTVNGTERQRFAVADLAHSVPAAVRAWGRCVLDVGDAVGLGAAICRPNPGNAVDSPIAVKSGDALEVACEPIGTLTARIG